MTELINSLSFHPSLKIPHLILADPALRNMYQSIVTPTVIVSKTS